MSEQGPFSFKEVMLRRAYQRKLKFPRYDISKPIKKANLSSLLYCLRKGVFDALNPLPDSAKQYGWFLRGKSTGSAIEETITFNEYSDDGLLFYSQKDLEIEWVVAHPDLYETEEEVIIELKSVDGDKIHKIFPDPEGAKRKTSITQKFKLLNDPQIVEQQFPEYIKQLKGYMVISGFKWGKMCFYLSGGNASVDDPFAEVTYTMTDEERRRVRDELNTKGQIFVTAVNAKNPELAPHVQWVPDDKWQCYGCKYREPCDEMFHREMQMRIKMYEEGKK